jgi:hypothetical protein
MMNCHGEGELLKREPKAIGLREELLDRDGVKEFLQVPKKGQRVLTFEAGDFRLQRPVFRSVNCRSTGGGGVPGIRFCFSEFLDLVVIELHQQPV